MSDRGASRSVFRLLSLLLFFVFGGAVVGETVALSIVVSVLGPRALSRMYAVNGVLLFCLPVLYFRYIDRFRRERLLAGQLLGTVALLAVFVALSSFKGGMLDAVAKGLLLVVYPLGYLSKTVNFLAFWTLANDVSDTGEAKKTFPVIAAWGFVGGLLGSFVAWTLLKVVDAETVVWLWAGLYLMAWVVVKKIRRQHLERLLRTETVHVRRESLAAMVRDVLRIRLVRVMAVLYLLVFVGVFSLDYLFWKQCHQWFPTSKSLASFQFSFYLVHATVTIIALYFVLPLLISRVGFVRILFSLPLVLVSGATVLLAVRWVGADLRLQFASATAFQFLRHVVFENGFSPIYQMFFVAIPVARRGRAKTFLEGIVKPAALVGTGVYLTRWGGYEALVLTLVFCVSTGLISLVVAIRRTYIEELLPRASSALRTRADDIVAGIGSAAESKIVSLVEEYARSPDPDLRALAVRIMSRQATREGLARLREMYAGESDAHVRVTIARSLGGYYWYETRGFIERLLKDEHAGVRAGTLSSLGVINARWKWEFLETARRMLFDSDLEVLAEAARFMWASGQEQACEAVITRLNTLLNSPDSQCQRIGLRLMGVLQPHGWESVLMRNVTADAPLHVFGEAVEMVFRYASEGTKAAALTTIEGLSRERIAVAGRAAEAAGPVMVPALMAFIAVPRSRRVSFEVVHVLRVIRCAPGGERVALAIDARTERNILRWIVHELHSVYTDAWVWVRYRQSAARGDCLSGAELLESALRERAMRVAEWALDGVVLLDREGLIAWGRRDLDMREYANRLDMIEILESLGYHRVGSLIVPLLKFESWENIAARGRAASRRYAPKERRECLRHFACSDNKWVSLCALYVIYQSEHPDFPAREGEEWLSRLCSDENGGVARAAAALRDPAGRKQDAMETFELLETVLFLKKTPLFCDVAGEKLMSVAEICEEKWYEKGTTISHEGEVADNLFVVKTGSVQVVKKTAGGVIPVAVIGPGGTYGEVGMFSQERRSASAVALEDCRVYEIQRSALKRLLMRTPEVAYNFLQIFSRKLRASGDDAVVREGQKTQAI